MFYFIYFIFVSLINCTLGLLNSHHVFTRYVSFCLSYLLNQMGNVLRRLRGSSICNVCSLCFSPLFIYANNSFWPLWSLVLIVFSARPLISGVILFCIAYPLPPKDPILDYMKSISLENYFIIYTVTILLYVGGLEIFRTSLQPTWNSGQAKVG